MNWIPHAADLAAQIVHPTSRWHSVIQSVPRHDFVPRWWTRIGESLDGPRWRLNEGPNHTQTWLETVYADRVLVTQAGTLHADHALPGNQPTVVATSASSPPSSLVRLFQHACLAEDTDVLLAGIGSGYGCALLATRLGDAHVTSIDIDERVTRIAAERLAAIDLHPKLASLDATGPLPGSFDRIIADLAVSRIPVTWLDALRPGGRLVTGIAGTTLLLTADKTPDGGAVGRIEWEPVALMTARIGGDGPGRLASAFESMRNQGGEQTSEGRYPVIDVQRARELSSMFGVTVPGCEHHYQAFDDGRDAAWMFHPDGSWARGIGSQGALPTVYQGGPRRLWDILDRLRSTWIRDGSSPVYGATAAITQHGVIKLEHGRWRTTLY